ncbi:MAG: hypothetical protein AAF611_02535 [Bacteroidota bacterium]
MPSLQRLSIYCVLLFSAFTCICVLATFYPIWVSIGTHMVFPIAVMLIFGMLTQFGYIKLSTLIFGRLLIILAVFGIGDEYIEVVWLLLLQCNILEATILDFIKKKYFNVVSGLLLLGSSFYLALRWTGSYVLVDNENYLLWIFAYTIWNANFVTMQLSGAYFTHHFLILLSPIIACFVLSDFSYWLMFRETSLLLGIATLASIKETLFRMEQEPPFSDWFEEIYQFIIQKKTQILLSGVVGICILIQLFFL